MNWGGTDLYQGQEYQVFQFGHMQYELPTRYAKEMVKKQLGEPGLQNGGQF